jgi:hypothetical protein
VHQFGSGQDACPPNSGARPLHGKAGFAGLLSGGHQGFARYVGSRVGRNGWPARLVYIPHKAIYEAPRWPARNYFRHGRWEWWLLK